MSGGSHFVAMTTPMSLQPWWWQIFILIQLWSQFFQMFVYGDVVYAQTWYWPWKTVSSHLQCQDGLWCYNMALISFRLFRKNLGNLRDFFGQMVYRPPWQKISRTPMLRNDPTNVKIGFSCNRGPVWPVVCACSGFCAVPSLQFPFDGVSETDHLT